MNKKTAKSYIEAMRVRSGGATADDLEAALGDRLREAAYADAGYMTRKLADSVLIPPLPATARKQVEEQSESESESEEEVEERRIRSSNAASSSALRRSLPNAPRSFPEGYRLRRAHGATVTAVTLSSDAASVFSVSKDGSLVRTDTETGKRAATAAAARRPPGAPTTHEAAARMGKSLHTLNPTAAANAAAPWAASRRSAGASAVGGGGKGAPALLAVAASDCGRWVAAGGTDGAVHAYDARTLTHVRSHAGHIGAVTSLAFAPGAGAAAAAAAAGVGGAGAGGGGGSTSLPCGDLYSGGADGTVKIWSLDDGAYVDSLFGHQAAVLSLAVARGGAGGTGRPISGGADRTCRLWKVAEETQLIFRAPSQSVDAVCSVGGGGGEWVSGGADGALCLWSPLKKRPAAKVAAAHASMRRGAPRSSDPVRSWIGAVAASRGGDLVASGAGDGSVRLWAARGVGGSGGGSSSGSSQRSLEALGSLPAPGFVNGLAISRDARVLVAGVGPEPRLGRWSRAPSARPALVVQRLRHEGDDDGRGDDE